MRYKAVCEELWSIARDAPSSFLYRRSPRRSSFLRLPPSADRGRVGTNSARMRDNNKNRRPRSDARKHMGHRSHVPAGISLSGHHFRSPIVEPSRRSIRQGASCVPAAGDGVTQLLADPIMALAALVVLLLVGALVWAGSRRPYVREVERLREDLHGLLASAEPEARIAVNGRLSAFVDISASMNRLLDRSDDAARVAAQVEPLAAPTSAASCSIRSPTRCPRSR